MVGCYQELSDTPLRGLALRKYKLYGGKGMKYGIRKPSIKKSINAKNPITQAKKKYSTKKYTDPIGTAKKKAYNKVYNKASFSINDIGKSKSSKSKSTSSYNYNSSVNYDNYDYDNYSIEDIKNLSPFVGLLEKYEKEEREKKERYEREQKERYEMKKRADEETERFDRNMSIFVLVLVSSPILFFFWLVSVLFS